MITNKDVKDALTHCINNRWKLIAKGRLEWYVSKCALCELFGGHNEESRRNGRFKPSNRCKGCPVYLRNGGKGCATGSHFMKFIGDRTPESAQAMLQFLRDTRKHFFGDGK